jgi:hypothetical protein
MLRSYQYLLIGGGAATFKAATRLQRPVRAGVKTETYWNNRVTPLPPGVHLLLREEFDQLPQWQLQQPQRPAIDLALGDVIGDGVGSSVDNDISDRVLQQAEALGLPALQPATTTGLFPDTRLQAYEEQYRQDKIDFIFQQGIVHFALDFENRWVFIGTEPQATHLTIVTDESTLPVWLTGALAAAAALPTIAPAQHAQQLTRMQSWWWGGDRPVNYPVTEQLPEMVELEIESKLAVTGDFSAVSWQLSDCLRTGAIAGFALHSDDLLVRHTHDIVRYLKGKHKLILQGAAYRFGQKSLKFAQDVPAEIDQNSAFAVMIRNEVKPAYSPVSTAKVAKDIQRRAQALKPIGDLYCHKRKFLLESVETGGGYHVLIDYSQAFAQPGQTLAQIEVECQWKKIPIRQSYADPVRVAIDEIQQITRALCSSLHGVEATRTTKRKWLKQTLSATNNGKASKKLA